LIDAVKIIITRHTPDKQQSNHKEAAKQPQSNHKATTKQPQRSSKATAKHNDILRFVPFHHPTHHLHWTYDGLDNVVLL